MWPQPCNFDKMDTVKAFWLRKVVTLYKCSLEIQVALLMQDVFLSFSFLSFHECDHWTTAHVCFSTFKQLVNMQIKKKHKNNNKKNTTKNILL